MKKLTLRHRRMTGALLICLSVAAISFSFQNVQFVPLEQYDQTTDTTPPSNKQHLTIRQYNELLQNFDNEMKRLHQQVGQLNTDQLNHALASVDLNAALASAETALKNIDFEALGKEIHLAMKGIDNAAINKDIQQSLEEAKKALQQVDKAAIRKELEAARKEIEKSTSALKNIQFDKIMEEAREGMQRAKEELKQQKAMFDEMEKDGLINSSRGFSIEMKKGRLFINGQQQPDSVQQKYEKYLNNKDDYSITIDKE